MKPLLKDFFLCKKCLKRHKAVKDFYLNSNFIEKLLIKKQGINKNTFLEDYSGCIMVKK